VVLPAERVEVVPVTVVVTAATVTLLFAAEAVIWLVVVDSAVTFLLPT